MPARTMGLLRSDEDARLLTINAKAVDVHSVSDELVKQIFL